MPGIKFALGENPKRRGGGAGAPVGTPPRYPGTRMGVEYVIRDAFARAKAYQKDWQDYDRRKKAGEQVVAPRRDLQLEPLVEILEGKRLVHAHSYRADEILMLLRVADEFGFKIATLQHVLEGYKVAKEIAAHGAGASTFADWWGYKIEAIDAIPYNAALMTRKGVVASINSDDAELARHLNTEAAKSIKWGGLSDDEALALVTINPAKQLRIDNRVGSIEVGKDADVVIWNKHPLSTYAIVDRVYIDGQRYYDRQDDAKHQAELAKEKEALINAERGERRSPTTTESGTPRDPRASSGGPSDDQSRLSGADLRVGRRGGHTASARYSPSQRCVHAPAHRHPRRRRDHQREDLPDRQTRDRARHHRHSRRRHRSRRRERQRALRRSHHRRSRRRGVSRLHQRADDDGAGGSGSGRIRRRQRNPRLQPAAARTGRLPQRQRGHSGRSRERADDRRRHARRRPARRSGRGDGSRRLHVGGEHRCAVGRRDLPVPAHRRRRSRRWRRTGSGTRSPLRRLEEGARRAARSRGAPARRRAGVREGRSGSRPDSTTRPDPRVAPADRGQAPAADHARVHRGGDPRRDRVRGSRRRPARDRRARRRSRAGRALCSRRKTFR